MTKNDTSQDPANEQADTSNLQTQIDETTADLQRTRADFENYRKRVEGEKQAARANGQAAAILKLLPIIDTIDRAVAHVPQTLAEDAWAQGIAKLPAQLAAKLGELNVARIEAAPGTEFNPNLHEAIQFEEDAEGDKEVIAEELQAGYTLNGTPLRHAMVRVTRK